MYTQNSNPLEITKIPSAKIPGNNIYIECYSVIKPQNKKISVEGARPQKGLKFDLFQEFYPKIFIFEYFPKIPSKMNSRHPFYPILIPNTPYEKFSLFLFLFVGGSQGVPKI